ncbi:acetolactate synthase small subunit [Chloroflexota bacterium]
MATPKHTLVALVEDKPGVLTRMASLFRRRGFNIESIAVGRSESPHLSRMTIVITGPSGIVEQVRKQVDKIVNVVRVVEISSDDMIARELALIKVKADSTTRSEIMQIVDIFRANIVNVTTDMVTVEATGDEEKIESLCNLLSGFGIQELARTGRIAMNRSS